MARPRLYEVTDDDIVDYLRAHVTEHGYPPSVREVGDRFGWASSSVPHMRLRRLVDAGRLSAVPGRPRTLRVVE